MEPLSISMAVIGLLKTAHEVSSTIGKIVSSKKNGCKEIRNVKSTVDTLRSVLLQLQLLLLNHAKIDDRRASMILVEEVVVTLSACVMTFSDLDRCVEGLASDERLGILDSVRWASKAEELKGYMQSLESHKLSLTLMVNILTCQTTHNLENNAAELKVLMVQVLESNAALAERMSLLETAQMNSVSLWEDHDSVSVLDQRTTRAPRNDTPNLIASGTAQFHPTYAFEEVLSKSWVYQRCLGRDSRTFSIVSSDRLTQVTQSWSILTGLSLSNISNIAIQSLPVYVEDLNANHLYSFKEEDKANKTQPQNYLEGQRGSNSQSLRKRAAINPLVPLPALSETTPLRSQEAQGSQEAEKLSEVRGEVPNHTDFLLPSVDLPLPILDISHKVLFLAASISEFNTVWHKWEAGYPFLRYRVGAPFEVLADKAEMWLARNLEDPEKKNWLDLEQTSY